MSDNATDPTPEKHMLDLKQLTVLLIKHFGLHQGVHEVSVNFEIIAGGFANAETGEHRPGVLSTLQGLGLSASKEGSPMGVDAAEVNPPKPKNVRRPRS